MMVSETTVNFPPQSTIKLRKFFLKHSLLCINCVLTRILLKMQSDVSLVGKAGKSG